MTELTNLSDRFRMVCMLCGSRCPDKELLEQHLEAVHQTTSDELRHLSPTTTGPQGPGARRS